MTRAGKLASIFTALSLAACGGQSSVTEVAEDTQVSALSHSAALAASCSGCHLGGSMGIPSIETLGKDALTASLQAYKTDAQGTTVMHRIARGYSDQQLAEIAAYLSARGDTP